MNIDVEILLDELGIKRASKLGSELRFSCPFPEHSHGDSNPSASINVKTGAWNCLGCHRVGYPKALVEELLDLSPFAANRWLKERFDEDYVLGKGEVLDAVEKILSGSERGAQAEQRELVELPATFSTTFRIKWDLVVERLDSAPDRLTYMINRGFSAETLSHFGIGFDYATDRITVPVHDLHGRLVGFRGRSIGDQMPRYMVLRIDDGTYPISEVVWNLDGAELTERAIRRELIVCEGEFDAMALWQLGFRNVVATQGSNVSETQAQLIASRCDRAVFFYDSDEAGWKGMVRAARRLDDKISVTFVPQHDDDPSAMLEAMGENAKSKISSLIESSLPSSIAASM